MKKTVVNGIAASVLIIFSFTMLAGCATKGQTGAAVGAGTGALIGGLANMHGSWGATALIGAAAGAGIGYLIGNEEDKKDAQKRTKASEDELRPFAGTAWTMVSVTPKPREPYRSMTSNFGWDGSVTTTKVFSNGKTETTTEKYRVVGNALILSRDNEYVENTRYSMEGNRVVIDTGTFTVVMQRSN